MRIVSQEFKPERAAHQRLWPLEEKTKQELKTIEIFHDNYCKTLTREAPKRSRNTIKT